MAGFDSVLTTLGRARVFGDSVMKPVKVTKVAITMSRYVDNHEASSFPLACFLEPSFLSST